MKEYPYWLDTLPTTQHPAALNIQLPERVDVAIVGGGYTGLAAARQLARSGGRVIVLERETIGWGASSRNGGQVLAGMKVEPAELVRRYGEPRAKRLFAASLEAIDALEQLIRDEAIACDYERPGHVQAAFKPSHFAEFREEQGLLARVFHHRVELIPREHQRRELGTDFYHGLLIDDRSGALNPAKYVHGLAAAACRAGAMLASAVAVERVTRTVGNWSVETSRGMIHATDVLFATNGYTDGSAPALRRRLVPIGSYIIATEPLSNPDAAAALPTRRVVFDSKYFLYYFRLSADNRLLFGGRAEFSQPDEASTRRAAAILETAMARIFPELARKRIDYAWSGNVAFTRDQLPHAGVLDDAYYAAGYCGHGVAMATYLGGLIARRIAGERVDHPLLEQPFPPIPLYHGKPWFLPLVGAYYKMKDLIG